MDSFSKYAFYCSGLPHYVDYLAPLYDALPDELHGEFFTRGPGIARAKNYGITPSLNRVPRKTDDIFIVAGQQDAARVSPVRCVLVNHGVGQTYSSDHPSYTGGIGRANVVLHLCPSQRDADINSEFAESVAVGPYKLDPWLSGQRPRRPRSVYISFHHDANLDRTPEGQSAFRSYKDELKNLVRRLHFIGHGHPRAQPHLSLFWKKINAPFQPDFRRVLDDAAVYVCDNSSTLYEAAAVGIPVVVLNDPSYRRNVHHGLRFWEYADVGIQVNDPADLFDAIDKARQDPLRIRLRRQRIVHEVYSGLADGEGLQRVTRALVEFHDRHAAQGHRS